MDKNYTLALDIINIVIDKLDKGLDYKSIKEYLEKEKEQIELENSKIKDDSSEYIDKLVKNLK